MILDNGSEGSEGVVILTDLLNRKDIRCNNNNCTIKNICARFKQHLIDKSKYTSSEGLICSTFSNNNTGFNYEKDCNYFIKIKK